MKNVARDEFGVLSSKNTVSKYWGVSKVKGKDLFTVRFMEQTNREVITFKTNFVLSEVACAVIAARFFDDRNLYALAEEPVEVDFDGSLYRVNTCTNVISVTPKKVENPLVGYVQETNKTTEVFEKLLDDSKKVEEIQPISYSKPKKKEKSVNHFRNRVDAIIADALTRAKAKLAAEAEALYA